MKKTMTKRKYYWSIKFRGGMAYVVAVSREAAIRQVKQAKIQNKYDYQINTLQRISKKEFDNADPKISQNDQNEHKI